MSMLIKETQGDTIVGGIDGVNVLYIVTFVIKTGTIAVYVNGGLVNPLDPNGYTIVGLQSINMKIALTIGDVLEIEYESDMVAGGGADGGCPMAPEIETYQPYLLSDQLLTITETGEIVPIINSQGTPVPITLTDELIPVILSAE